MGLSSGLLRIALGFTGDLDTRMAQMERAVKKVLGV
jgi:methionine-gamma-lyase